MKTFPANRNAVLLGACTLLSFSLTLGAPLAHADVFGFGGSNGAGGMNGQGGASAQSALIIANGQAQNLNTAQLDHTALTVTMQVHVSNPE
jgi:hypothetical protein